MLRCGLHVEVVTQTPDSGDGSVYPYPVHRRPSRSQLLRLVRSCDLVYQNNISLNTLWPLLFVRRPLVITSQTPIDATIERSALKRKLKFLAMRFATSCTSCSQYLASTFPVPSHAIHNPYRSDIFRPASSPQPRDKELIFVGRLVQAKGLDILITALKLLRDRSITPALTVVGSGAEEAKLRALVADFDLGSKITFLGPRQPEQVAELLHRHRILVVPSRRQPAEAFGIVALEGVACGAVPVVAEQGGLPEAIGPCGLTFETENPVALADSLQRLLADPELEASLRARAANHLMQFEEAAIFHKYLEILQQALPGFKLLGNFPKPAASADVQ